MQKLVFLAVFLVSVAFGNSLQNPKSVVDSLEKMPLQQYFRDFGFVHCVATYKNDGDERADEIIALHNAYNEVAKTTQDSIKGNAQIYEHIRSRAKNLNPLRYKDDGAYRVIAYHNACLAEYVSKEYKAFIDSEIRAICPKCKLPKDKYATLPPSNTHRFHNSYDANVYKLKEFALSWCNAEVQQESDKQKGIKNLWQIEFGDIRGLYLENTFPKITSKMKNESAKRFNTLFDKTQGENAFAKCLAVYNSDELDRQINAVVKKHCDYCK